MNPRLLTGLSLGLPLALGLGQPGFATSLHVGYETFRGVLAYDRIDRAQGAMSTRSRVSEPVFFGEPVVGVEIHETLWKGLGVGLEGGAAVMSHRTAFDCSRMEHPAAGKWNAREGDEVLFDVQTYPLFVVLGWDVDAGPHRIRIGAGLGMVLVSAATTTRDQWWTDGLVTSYDPNDLAVPANRAPSAVDETHRVDTAPVRAGRLVLGYAYRITEGLRLGVDATVTPMSNVKLSGRIGAQQFFGAVDEPILSVGKPTIGTRIALSGGF